MMQCIAIFCETGAPGLEGVPGGVGPVRFGLAPDPTVVAEDAGSSSPVPLSAACSASWAEASKTPPGHTAASAQHQQVWQLKPGDVSQQYMLAETLDFSAFHDGTQCSALM